MTSSQILYPLPRALVSMMVRARQLQSETDTLMQDR